MNYWTNRVVEQQNQLFERGAAAANRELNTAYRDLAKDLFGEVYRMYAKLDKPAAEVRANDLYKNQRFFNLLNHMNEKLQSLGQQEIRITDSRLLEMYDATCRVVGDSISFQMPITDSKDILNKVWCPDGRHWSDRVWKNKEYMAQHLEKGILDCVERGVNKDTVVKELTDILGVGRRQADRLVRTELTFVQNSAAADTYQKAGIDEYCFLAAHDERVDDDCAELDGKVFRFDEMVIGENFPPIHCNCRCTIIPVVK